MLDGSLIIQFYNGVLILVEMELTACYGAISHFTFIRKFKIFYSNMARFNSVFHSSFPVNFTLSCEKGFLLFMRRVKCNVYKRYLHTYYIMHIYYSIYVPSN